MQTLFNTLQCLEISYQYFKKDGRWSEITLLDLKREEDNVFMKIECKTIFAR